MPKNIFQPKAAMVRKKINFLVSAQITERLSAIEIQAEKAGVSFPLNELVEDAIERILRQAEVEIERITVEESGRNAQY
jgi:hypothetical protein